MGKFYNSQYHKFNSSCEIISDEYHGFIDKVHLIHQFMLDVVHDLSPVGDCSKEDVVERINNYYVYCNAVMVTSFYRDFVKYLSQDGILNRHEYRDLSLNTPVHLNQSVSRFTQCLFEQGGLVPYTNYHFFLMKILSLYQNTLDQDQQRLQQAHTYLDICSYFYRFRSEIRVLLRSLGRQPHAGRELAHQTMLSLYNDLKLLLTDL